MKPEREKSGLSIVVYNNDINRALRKLKKKIQAERVFQELQKHEFYEKPSIKRKQERARARKRWLKKQAEIRATI